MSQSQDILKTESQREVPVRRFDRSVSVSHPAAVVSHVQLQFEDIVGPLEIAESE
jgi:hypothetical protein